MSLRIESSRVLRAVSQIFHIAGYIMLYLYEEIHKGFDVLQDKSPKPP